MGGLNWSTRRCGLALVLFDESVGGVVVFAGGLLLRVGLMTVGLSDFFQRGWVWWLGWGAGGRGVCCAVVLV